MTTLVFPLAGQSSRVSRADADVSPLAGPGPLRDAGVQAVRAGGRDRLRRGRRRAGPEAPEPLAVDHRLLASLIPFARKARTHSEAQVALIAGSIREYGFTNPVLVDGESGIIAGHGRVLAARKLGLG